MRIIDGFVDWSRRNLKVEVRVDRLPHLKEMVFEQRGPLYYAEKGAKARFFAYSAPGTGFGGAEFPIRMKDGSEKVLKGPWSSRAGCMNEAGFGPCVNLTIRTPEGWGIAGAVTLYSLIEACEDGRIDFGKGPERHRIGDGYDPALAIVRPRFMPPGEFIHAPAVVSRLGSVFLGRRDDSEILGLAWWGR